MLYHNALHCIAGVKTDGARQCSGEPVGRPSAFPCHCSQLLRQSAFLYHSRGASHALRGTGSPVLFQRMSRNASAFFRKLIQNTSNIPVDANRLPPGAPISDSRYYPPGYKALQYYHYRLNVSDIQQLMPLCRHKNILIRLFGILLLNTMLAFGLFVLMFVIESIFFPA